MGPVVLHCETLFYSLKKHFSVVRFLLFPPNYHRDTKAKSRPLMLRIIEVKMFHNKKKFEETAMLSQIDIFNYIWNILQVLRNLKLN